MRSLDDTYKPVTGNPSLERQFGKAKAGAAARRGDYAPLHYFAEGFMGAGEGAPSSSVMSPQRSLQQAWYNAGRAADILSMVGPGEGKTLVAAGAGALAKVPRAVPKTGPQTVAGAQRLAFPGVYMDPADLARMAEAKVAPESPMLERLFGVTRADLAQIAERQGNVPGTIPGAPLKPRGSEAAAQVMTPANERRIISQMEAAREYAPNLWTGMKGWYVMDPAYNRLVELVGPQEAGRLYERLNVFGGIESPNLPVPKEFQRASAAHWLAEQGRWEDWTKYGGLKGKKDIPDLPEGMSGIPGRVGHKRAVESMTKYLKTGEHAMESPKAPPYIQASSVPELGFQTGLPIGDAHWSRYVGLADVRTSKGFAESVSTPEIMQLAPWWRGMMGEQVGIEAVPGQAIAWGLAAPQTGVKTKIGAPKLELWATEMARRAKELGTTPEAARDLILLGQERGMVTPELAAGMAIGGGTTLGAYYLLDEASSHKPLER